MTESAPFGGRPERAFLDASVLQDRLRTQVFLALAEWDVFEPRTSQDVMAELVRDRPVGVTEAQIGRRIAAMNGYVPFAVTSGYEGLTGQMQADPKARQVLAAAVHSRSDVLVTANTRPFAPPSTGPYAMRVETMSDFLSRKLQEQPDRVRAVLRDLAAQLEREPASISALIDALAAQPELRRFAQNLDATVEPHERRIANQSTARSAAFDGLTPPRGRIHNNPENSPPHTDPQTNPPDRDIDRNTDH